MKLIKMLFVGSVLMLVGCSSFQIATEPMYNIQKRCGALGHTNKQSLECMVKAMKERDIERKKYGLVTKAGIYEEKLAQLQSFESTFKQKEIETQKIYEKEKEIDKTLEQNKLRDRCLLMSDAQLQDAIDRASSKGDYDTLEKLFSREYRESIVMKCIKEARK